MMTVKDENEYIDLAEVDLDTFTPYGRPIRERLDEYTSHYSQGYVENPQPENPFYNFIRGNGYIPSIEDARKWSLGVMKNKEPIDGMSALDLTPASEEWFSIQMKDAFDYIASDLEILERQFIGGFDIPNYVKYISDEDGIDYENDEEPYFENMGEVLESVRIEHKNTIEKAFKIGFLYHDAWWKARHEEAARKYYEIVDKNKTSGQTGGDVNAKKKRVRYQCLDNLARENIKKFNMASDKEAIREAKRLARSHDKGSNEPLFHIKGKLLSNEWFAEWRDEFRKIAREI